MAKVIGTVEVDRERCKGCELCVVACPADVLALSSEVNSRGYNFSHMKAPEKCVGCTSCAAVCPDSVIEVYRLRIA